MTDENDKQHGKYGTEKHRFLIKKAIDYITERYMGRYGPVSIKVESDKITASADTSGRYLGYSSMNSRYELHPDITCEVFEDKGDIKKKLIVECETSKYNMLTDEMRMTAYRLLRLKYSDKNKMMMYIAFPKKLKGEVEKPDYFNDLWFFNLGDQ